MDFEHIKRIKKYTEQIKKFKSLDCNKKLSREDFKKKMISIFPKFYNDSPKLFDNLIFNDDLSILNLMFHKLDIIEDEYKRREKEVDIVTPFIKDAQEFLKDKKKVKKNKLHNFFRDNKNKYSTDYKKFINKYPVIIERLIDDDDYDFNPESLLYKQVKFSHEIDIGKVLTQKYVEPYVKK